MKLYQELIEALDAGRACCVETRLAAAEGDMGTGLRRRLTELVPAHDAKGRLTASVTLEEEDGALLVREPVLPRERLIVLGGGQNARRPDRRGSGKERAGRREDPRQRRAYQGAHRKSERFLQRG